MIDALKARILFILSLAPLLEAFHIASMNLYMDHRVRNFFTIADYISISLHRIGSVVIILSIVMLGSFMFSVAFKYNTFNATGKRNLVIVYFVATLSIMTSIQLLTFIFSDYSVFSWIYTHIMKERKGWENLIPAYISFIVPAYFILRFYLVPNDKNIQLSMFFDSKFDALVAIIFIPIIIFDFQISEKPKFDKVEAQISSCMSESKQDVQSAIPLERGLLIFSNDTISLLSYDCLKRVDYK